MCDRWKRRQKKKEEEGEGEEGEGMGKKPKARKRYFILRNAIESFFISITLCYTCSCIINHYNNSEYLCSKCKNSDSLFGNKKLYTSIEIKIIWE